MAKAGARVPSSKLSTAKVSLPKVSAPQVNGRTQPVRLHQNPFSPVPGNVSATSKPGGAAGDIPIPSMTSPALSKPPSAGKPAPTQKFAEGGLVKPGGSGSLPVVMSNKSIKCDY